MYSSRNEEHNGDGGLVRFNDYMRCRKTRLHIVFILQQFLKPNDLNKDTPHHRYRYMLPCFYSLPVVHKEYGTKLSPPNLSFFEVYHRYQSLVFKNYCNGNYKTSLAHCVE